MKLITNVISSNLIKQGINLSVYGINEYAWDSANIKIITEELAEKKIGILGGDVYKVNGDKIEMTYDSWYLNDDGMDDFYQKSINKAIEYIKEYENNNSGNFVYSITI